MEEEIRRQEGSSQIVKRAYVRAVIRGHHVATSICSDTSSDGGALQLFYYHCTRFQPVPHDIPHLLLYILDTLERNVAHGCSESVQPLLARALCG